LAANQPELLTGTEPPEWVTDWLKKQAAVAKRKEILEENKAAGKVATPSPKTVEKRQAQVAAGIEHLDLWLNDLIRNGIGTLETQPTTFWESQAARLVDNQAPGLASRLRRMATIPNSNAAWPEKLLAQLGSLALLSEAFQRLDQFEPDFQEDIRQLVGWTVKEDQVVVSGEHVTDDWLFVGQIVEDTERGKNQRTWLLGQQTGRAALVLQFSYAGTPFAETYPLGSKQKATLAYWPGIQPQRALLHKREGAVVPVQERLPGHETCAAFFDEVATTLAQSPWRERFLCVLHDVVPVYDAEHNQWWIYDRQQHAMPLQNQDHWLLLALSGGHPVDFVGEWNGERLLPLLLQHPLTDQGREENQTSLLPTSSDGGNANRTTLNMSRNMNKLVTTAIVGTGQQATIDLATGTAVDALTQQLTREQPERTVLLAAGAWALYQQAGYSPQELQISQSPAPAEEVRVCSPKVAQILTDFFQEKHDILLPEALARLQQVRQRLPHELLPQALVYGAKSKQGRAALLPVLGARGRWLAQFSPAWNWASQTKAAFVDKPLPEIEVLWQEGTLQQRVEILRSVRTEHPDVALSWIVATWKKESVEARTQFIALLEINLSVEDEAFLEQALNNRSEGVRKTAAHLLALLSPSAFNQRMRERADTLLHYTDGMLQITPPETFDPTWKRDGITQDGEHGSENIWLLFQVISHVAPSHWEERFATSPARLLENIEITGWSEGVVKGWTVAAKRYNATAWFEPLLDWWSKHTNQDDKDKEYITLLNHLPQDRAEQYVLSHLFVGTIWIEELIALPRPWSSSFSKICLETLQQRALELANSPDNYRIYLASFPLIHTIVTAIPLDCFDLAFAAWTFPSEPADTKNSNAWSIKYWMDQENDLKTLLRLRKKILKEIL
jgi:hypothetical protein